MKKVEYGKLEPSNDGSKAADDRPYRDDIIAGDLVITKVIREHTPLMLTELGRGTSIGDYIDQRIESALRLGEEVQVITVELSEEYWKLAQEAMK